VKLQDAVEFIRPAVSPGGSWADFGSGNGLLTTALASLVGADGRVIAVDVDPQPLPVQRSADALARRAVIDVVGGDFRHLDAIPLLAGVRLSGAMFANSLHCVPHPGQVLAMLLPRLQPDAVVIVIEYETIVANRWVPYPLPLHHLQQCAAAAGYAGPQLIGSRPSLYHGAMYSAVLRPAPE
jgi:ubiquinone/menaquinone biosynthesis C-methylase UbiE